VYLTAADEAIDPHARAAARQQHGIATVIGKQICGVVEIDRLDAPEAAWAIAHRVHAAARTRWQGEPLVVGPGKLALVHCPAVDDAPNGAQARGVAARDAEVEGAARACRRSDTTAMVRPSRRRE
jgi:hypothetical protein